MLYIFGGHYNKEPIKDMVVYDVDTNVFRSMGDADTGDMSELIFFLSTRSNNRFYFLVPVGFTQRATLDVELNEIYVYFVGHFWISYCQCYLCYVEKSVLF